MALANEESIGNVWSGKMMKNWGQQETDQCLQCEEQETGAHVLPCKDPEAIQKFQASGEKLDKWIKASLTALDVQDILKQALLSWKKGEVYNQPPYLQEDIEVAF